MNNLKVPCVSYSPEKGWTIHGNGVPGLETELQKLRDAKEQSAKYKQILWRKNNKEKLAKQKRKHYLKNKAKCDSASKRGFAKRRAVLSKAPIGDLLAIKSWEDKWRSRRTIKCHWCGNRVLTRTVHVDHVIPLSKGGPHSVENLCVSCQPCNSQKHAGLPELFNSTLTQPLLFF